MIKKRLEIKIYGFVQGVFFRNFAQEVAQSLNLTGFAKNEADGTVLVVTEGKARSLKEFLKALKKGPKSAKVERVEVEWSEAKDQFKIFEIEY